MIGGLLLRQGWRASKGPAGAECESSILEADEDNEEGEEAEERLPAARVLCFLFSLALICSFAGRSFQHKNCRARFPVRDEIMQPPKAA
jgi:hypothetical protein